jgi:hypothetical protein
MAAEDTRGHPYRVLVNHKILPLNRNNYASAESALLEYYGQSPIIEERNG